MEVQVGLGRDMTHVAAWHVLNTATLQFIKLSST